VRAVEQMLYPVTERKGFTEMRSGSHLVGKLTRTVSVELATQETTDFGRLGIELVDQNFHGIVLPMIANGYS
jgi:hypothetical protein